ncbi:YbbC/YhhH family protein [Flavobacterium caeni]|uniref:NTF2 fold immunity protein n=1 Tax=Flavobacterium caeni TaxID=490189 RepID=A0A1G5KEH3_9FLAO|nr:YbbC/YhhH family protein [Flavobacterium caeni]SCY98339.1 NTF2 fold immunity protein [Flavobacterium caeni]
MKNFVFYFCFLLIIACKQNENSNQKEFLNRKQAEIELEEALVENIDPQNLPNTEVKFLNDETSAVKVAEKILFKIYGEKNIAKQKPYKVYLIKEFWIVSGTLPEGFDGGTFLVILDKRNSRILKISHGK